MSETVTMDTTAIATILLVLFGLFTVLLVAVVSLKSQVETLSRRVTELHDFVTGDLTNLPRRKSSYVNTGKEAADD